MANRLFGRLFGGPVTKAAISRLEFGPGTAWYLPILESFSGAWQRNIVVESTENLLAFSSVYACVSLIADDISKLRIKLLREDSDGILTEVNRNNAVVTVLRKPNRYQTRIQFLSQWMCSLLLQGNTYVLKERDAGIVTALYILDPRRVTAKVAPDGSVFYQLAPDNLAGIAADALPITVPASEIIHDRMITPWHPLCGVTPIYACGSSATQGIRIQSNSERFFQNMSRPSGHLTTHGTITQETADRLRRDFEANYSGNNIGRLMVTGDDLKYEAMTIPAQDAQLIEQLKWTVEDVARTFHVPLHKLSTGQNPTFSNVGALNQDYYSQTLQARIESIELLLDEGFGLAPNFYTELDTEMFLRMDPKSRAETTEIQVRSGVLAPNEARFKENYGPVEGGESPYLQMQNFSLAALAKRDAQEDPFAPATPPPSATPALPPPAEDPPALPAPDEQLEFDAEEAANVLVAVRSLSYHAQRDFPNATI